MASLKNQTKNKVLLDDIEVAKSFRVRLIGLMGRKSMKSTEGIWFPRSNWIHTLFMSIPIDVIYLDKKMTVRKIQQNLKPWRFPAPVFNAKSVIEVSSGFISSNNIEVGDQLNVGD